MYLFIMLVAIVFAIEFASYTLLIPDPSQKPSAVHSLDKRLGKAAYIIAYIFSLLRAPLGLLPYLVKLFIFFVLKVRYESSESTYFREVINMVGDFLNLGFTTVFVLYIAGPPGVQSPTFILFIPLAAELVRLLAERIPLIFSAAWQLIPHRKISQAVLARQDFHEFWSWVVRCFPRYCRYYSLGDAERTQFVLGALKHRAQFDKDLFNRLAYIQAFRIIPQRYGLRGGKVRDVARGEIYIHRTWTNDPWLLVGMALRRAPWTFDPRYLRRPFYYMTEANRLATLCVLEHARYSPPYAVFQFGHEIRVARLHFFYRLLRWLSIDIEEKVLEDGTFQFDQFIFWLQKRFAHGPTLPKQRYLYTDDEVIAEFLCNHDGDERITVIDVATRYTYPVKYIEEVLLDKITAALDRHTAVTSDGCATQSGDHLHRMHLSVEDLSLFPSPPPQCSELP